MNLTSETNYPQYCQYCGSILLDVSEDQFFRGKCTNCGTYIFMQYKVGIAAVIFRDDKLLLLKRAQNPWKGYWNTPAGFLEYEESITEGVKREVFEETGFEVKVSELHHVMKYDNDPRGHGIVLFYDCEIIGGEFVSNDEVLELKFFPLDELPDQIAGAGHEDFIELLKKERNIHD